MTKNKLAKNKSYRVIGGTCLGPFGVGKSLCTQISRDASVGIWYPSTLENTSQSHLGMSRVCTCCAGQLACVDIDY